MLVMMMLDRNPFHFAATCNRWSTCQGGGMGRQVWLPWPLRYSESTAPCQNLTCRVHRSREIKRNQEHVKRIQERYPMIFRHVQTMSIEFTMQRLSRKPEMFSMASTCFHRAVCQLLSWQRWKSDPAKSNLELASWQRSDESCQQSTTNANKKPCGPASDHPSLFRAYKMSDMWRKSL